jgi:hypothetical protein
MPVEVKTNLKRQYLVKRIKESNLSLLDYPRCSQMGYILKLAKDEFFFTAPEVVDDCFHTLKHVIELDEDLYQGLENKSEYLGLNCFGKQIRCFICDSFEHVQKDCELKH